MYARTSTIQSQPSAVEAGIAHVRDIVMPALANIEGFTGLSLLVDRSSGHCIATSAWESEEAMRASERSVQPVRDRAAEILGGTAQVEQWEIVGVHRDHRSREGSCVQVTWVKVGPDQIDRGIDLFKLTVLPALEELDGFCSASLMVNRGSGLGVSSVVYDSFDALEGNRAQLDRIRDAAIAEAGAEVLDQRDFELAIAHLRVPEMA